MTGLIMPLKKNQHVVKWECDGSIEEYPKFSPAQIGTTARRDSKKRSMQLKDVMKKDVEVVAPDTPLREAARKMSVLNLTMLPVCDGSRIVGLLTARDLTIRATAQGCDPRTAQVREVMMLPAVYGREDQNVHQAVDLMQRSQLHCLPVLDRQMRLVGIVSLRDLRGNDGSTGRSKSEPGARLRSRITESRPRMTGAPLR